MFSLGVLFTLVLGPYFGVQIVMAAEEENYYVIMKTSHYSLSGQQNAISGVRGSLCDPLPLLIPHVHLSVQPETPGVAPLDPCGPGLDHLWLGCLAEERLH